MPIRHQDFLAWVANSISLELSSALAASFSSLSLYDVVTDLDFIVFATNGDSTWQAVGEVVAEVASSASAMNLSDGVMIKTANEMLMSAFENMGVRTSVMQLPDHLLNGRCMSRYKFTGVHWRRCLPSAGVPFQVSVTRGCCASFGEESSDPDMFDLVRLVTAVRIEDEQGFCTVTIPVVDVSVSYVSLDVSVPFPFAVGAGVRLICLESILCDLERMSLLDYGNPLESWSVNRKGVKRLGRFFGLASLQLAMHARSGIPDVSMIAVWGSLYDQWMRMSATATAMVDWYDTEGCAMDRPADSFDFDLSLDTFHSITCPRLAMVSFHRILEWHLSLVFYDGHDYHRDDAKLFFCDMADVFHWTAMLAHHMVRLHRQAM